MLWCAFLTQRILRRFVEQHAEHDLVSVAIMFESFCFDSKLVLLNVSLHVHVDAYCDITLGYHVKRECSSPTLQHSGVVEGGEIFIDFIRILKFLSHPPTPFLSSNAGELCRQFHVVGIFRDWSSAFDFVLYSGFVKAGLIWLLNAGTNWRPMPHFLSTKVLRFLFALTLSWRCRLWFTLNANFSGVSLLFRRFVFIYSVWLFGPYFFYYGLLVFT